jgi:hypothetical protein
MTHWMDLEIAETELGALADEWAAAELLGDVARLDALLADRFTAVDGCGELLGRDEWMDRFGPGGLRYSAFAWKPDSIRVYGESAVVVGCQDTEGTDWGVRVRERCRATQLWVDGDGGWRLAALHVTPVTAG